MTQAVDNDAKDMFSKTESARWNAAAEVLKQGYFIWKLEDLDRNSAASECASGFSAHQPALVFLDKK